MGKIYIIMIFGKRLLPSNIADKFHIRLGHSQFYFRGFCFTKHLSSLLRWVSSSDLIQSKTLLNCFSCATEGS